MLALWRDARRAGPRPLVLHQSGWLLWARSCFICPPDVSSHDILETRRMRLAFLESHISDFNTRRTSCVFFFFLELHQEVLTEANEMNQTLQPNMTSVVREDTWIDHASRYLVWCSQSKRDKGWLTTCERDIKPSSHGRQGEPCGTPRSPLPPMMRCARREPCLIWIMQAGTIVGLGLELIYKYIYSIYIYRSWCAAPIT